MTTAQGNKLHLIRRFCDDVSLEQVVGGMLYDRYEAMMHDAPPERILALLQLAGPEPEATRRESPFPFPVTRQQSASLKRRTRRTLAPGTGGLSLCPAAGERAHTKV